MPLAIYSNPNSIRYPVGLGAAAKACDAACLQVLDGCEFPVYTFDCSQSTGGGACPPVAWNPNLSQACVDALRKSNLDASGSTAPFPDTSVGSRPLPPPAPKPSVPAPKPAPRAAASAAPVISTSGFSLSPIAIGGIAVAGLGLVMLLGGKKR